MGAIAAAAFEFRMTKFSIVICYYDQPKMLARQIEEWSTYPDDVEVVLVDDASPNHPASEVLEYWDGCPLRIFRILEDIPWNQMGARNLGMHHAKGPWVFCADVDHVLTVDQVDKVLQYPFERKHIYYPNRTIPWEPGSQMLRACNIYFVHREDFWNTRGYDERYRGNKGWSDVMLRHVFERQGNRFVGNLEDPTTNEFPITVMAYSNFDRPCEVDRDKHLIPDAWVHTLDRSVEFNKQMHLQHWRLINRSGVSAYLSQHYGSLNFAYEEVAFE